MTKFRPQQHVLDVFWTLSDGNDEQRKAGAVKLSEIIKTAEDKERGQLLQYCQERLVRGLSSGRKSARVGFSVALVQLLRENQEVNTSSVMSTIRNKLKIGGPDKKLQSEIGGICLGRAFAISALIQAGRVDQLSGDVLSTIIEELFSIAERKSYLIAVCDKVIRDLLLQVSGDVFGEKVWPKMKDKMSQGWKLCTLDRVAILLICRARFPEVITKKFLRKLWGFPVLSEANDEKLLAAVLASNQRSDILTEEILPRMLEAGRDPLSIWTAVGEQLLAQVSEKAGRAVTYRELGLKFAAKLLSNTTQQNQAVDILLSPQLARCVFNSEAKRSNPRPAEAIADFLYQQICQKLAGGQTSILSVVERIWKLESSMLQQQLLGRAVLIKSHNFVRFLDLMSTDETEQYSRVLIAMIMGNDQWNVMSCDAPAKLSQMECCLRQLHHLSVGQSHSMTETTQNSILALFLRLAFFQVTTATKDIEHCGSCINLQETDTARKLSEVFFHKALDSSFTLSGKQKNWELLSRHLDTLYGLACYVQVLLDSQNAVPIKLMLSQVQAEWRTLVDLCTKLRQQSDAENQELHFAFVLLTLFLGMYMLTDFQMAKGMLQDVYICCQKAGGVWQEDENENEPQWIEVVTDLLLKIMSLPSHLGRVVAAIVFRLLSEHVTHNAIALITEVLIPSKSSGDNMEDVLMDADDSDNFDDDEGEASDISSIHEDESEDGATSTDVSDEGSETAASYHLEEEGSLSDLSDSEMFKMDTMLAEVFKQKQKSGKKARQEKRQEMINFQIRVLDLVEVVIKGTRCGDFVFNLLKPLCMLMIKSTAPGSNILAEKAKSLFMVIKSNVKVLRDNVQSVQDQRLLFAELLHLASKVTDKRHLQQLSTACYMLVSSRPCVELLMNALEKVITKKSCKPHVTFFNMLLECDPIHFQQLAPKLVDRLKNKCVRPQGRMICCLVLASLCKKTENVNDADVSSLKQWMTEAAEVVTQMMFSLDKVMFYKEVLTLVAAIQARQDILLPKVLFGDDVKEHLIKLKSKLNTDIRRLASRVISSIDQQKGQLKTGKKRKCDGSAKSPSPVAKKTFI